MADDRARKRRARLAAAEAVRSYKRLARVERAFRSLKTVDLKVRPIHHRKPAAGEALRPSVVAPAQRPPRATTKAETKRTAAGSPVHSFQTLLADLATLTKNRVQPKAPGSPAFDVIATPTDLQRRTFELLGASPRL